MMSDYEHNKGKLIPLGPMDEERAERLIGGIPEWASTAIEAIDDDPENYGIVKIGAEYYRVEFEVNGGQMISEFCTIEKKDNGVILFNSQHYNGGAHWTEVVEEAIK